jgi:ferredoxin
MSAQVYYFSGTGNSLHVSRELKRRLPETTLVPMISVLNSGTATSSADTVGFVFPIHAFSIPFPVRRFLQQADLSSASYLFAIATRECSSRVYSDIDRLLEKQGKRLDAYFSVEMPENYIPVFEVYSQEQVARTESGLQEKLDTVQDIVAGKRTCRRADEAVVFLLYRTLFPILTYLYHKTGYFGLEKAFYADSRCTECGTCERICLSERIRLENGGPQWRKDIDCTFCLACLHYCPAQAIQLRDKGTAMRGRYHHAQISAKDIAGQKCWGE